MTTNQSADVRREFEEFVENELGLNTQKDENGYFYVESEWRTWQACDSRYRAALESSGRGRGEYGF